MNKEITARDFELYFPLGAGAGGVVTGTVTCPAGEGWEVLGGWFAHSDPVARGGVWTLTRLGGAAGVLGEITVAVLTNIRSNLYTSVPLQGPLQLHPGDAINVTLDAITAGKVVTVQLCVLARKGETD